MKNTNKKIIIALCIVAVVLIALTALFSRKPNTQKISSNSLITPTQLPIRSTLPVKEQRRILAKYTQTYSNQVSSQENDSLKKFQTVLPYSSPNFEVHYSSRLNRYFISKKSTASDTELREFLRAHNLLDLYLKGYGGFIVTTKPFIQVERETEEGILSAEQEAGEEVKNTREQKNK